MEDHIWYCYFGNKLVEFSRNRKALEASARKQGGGWMISIYPKNAADEARAREILYLGELGERATEKDSCTMERMPIRQD